MGYLKDFYRQKPCAVCHGFFYEEEIQQDDDGRLLCQHCYINSFGNKKGIINKLHIELPWGMNLLQLFLVIAIIGLMVGIAVPNIIKIRAIAAERALINLYVDNQETDLGDLTEQVVTAYESGQSIEEMVTDIAELADVSEQEYVQLEVELQKCIDIDVEELKLGKAMQAIMRLEWYQDQLEQLDE